VTNAIAKACDAICAKFSVGQLGLGADNLAGPPSAIEEDAEWIPDGVPASALRDLHNGKVT
jgi:hypothetical protein